MNSNTFGKNETVQDLFPDALWEGGDKATDEKTNSVIHRDNEKALIITLVRIDQSLPVRIVFFIWSSPSYISIIGPPCS